MTLYEKLKSILDIPIIYLNFKSDENKEPIYPPFIAYMSTGQNSFLADNTIYTKENTYRLEYYFKRKNEELEDKLENMLLSLGYIYTKSEDVYINEEDVTVIYYDI